MIRPLNLEDGSRTPVETKWPSTPVLFSLDINTTHQSVLFNPCESPPLDDDSTIPNPEGHPPESHSLDDRIRSKKCTARHSLHVSASSPHFPLHVSNSTCPAKMGHEIKMVSFDVALRSSAPADDLDGDLIPEPSPSYQFASLRCGNYSYIQVLGRYQCIPHLFNGCRWLPFRIHTYSMPYFVSYGTHALPLQSHRHSRLCHIYLWSVF